MLGEPVDYLPGVEAVIAGKREPGRRDWIRLRMAGWDG